MTNGCILQAILLLCFFTTTALAVNYELLRYQQRRSNLASQRLLWMLNRNLQYCLEDRMDFEVPEEIKQPQQFQKEETVWVMHEMLQQIFDILTRNSSSTGWNETIAENLYMELYQQMCHLETALKKIKGEKDFTWGSMTTVLNLKKYYLRIALYLEDKLYSKCAWTVVHMEILRNFSFLNRLTGYLHN
ncbi:interferon beta-like [Saccopteryx bilineata]|uniref:interferon beta-like n=1 Tax=Saccopteryx bilineata TaxID=59482 RepID=UPI00338F2D39